MDHDGRHGRLVVQTGKTSLEPGQKSRIDGLLKLVEVLGKFLLCGLPSLMPKSQ